MNIFIKIKSTIIAIFILILPLTIYSFHCFCQIEFIVFVNDNNIDEIIQILEEDNLVISNNEEIARIELKKQPLSRYSDLKVVYKNKEFNEFGIKQESGDYQIIKYLNENFINIGKVINIINLIVLFLVIGFIIYCFKIKNNKKDKISIFYSK